MRYKFTLLLLIVLSFGAVSQDVSESISEAESLLFQTPKDALDVIAKLDGANPLTSEQNLQILDISVRAFEAVGQLSESELKLEKLRALAIETNNQFYLGRSLRHQGALHYTASHYKKAAESHREALAIFEKLDVDIEMARTLIALSSAVRTLGNYEEAIPIAEKALLIHRKIDHKKGIASAMMAIALAHKFLGNYSQSLKYLQDGLDISVAINDTNTVADKFYNIASIYVITEDFAQAKSYFAKALELDEKAGFKNDIAYDHIRLAEMEAKLGDIKRAKQHISTASGLFSEIGSLRNQGWALIVEGQIEAQVNALVSAAALLSDGIVLAKQSADKVLVARGNMLLADTMFRLNKHNNALALVDEVIEDAISRDNANQITSLLTTKSNALAAIGEHQSALQTIKFLHAYQDKRNNELQGRTIALLQNNIENQAKQHQIALLEKDRGLAEINMQKVRLERNVGIAIGVMVLLVALFWASKERYKRKVSAIRHAMLVETAKRKDDLLADVSHELRTPLTVLRLHVESLQHDLVDDPNDTYRILNNKIDALNKLIEDLYQLSLADSGGLSISVESTHAKAFLDTVIAHHQPLVEKAGLALTSTIEIDDHELVWIDTQRLQQTMSNLFSNSVRYTNSPGSIHLASRIVEGFWIVSIADSSPGVEESEIERLFERLYRVENSRSRETGGAGLGLAICKTIVEAHNGKIKIAESNQGGLYIKMSIPLESKPMK